MKNLNILLLAFIAVATSCGTKQTLTNDQKIWDSLNYDSKKLMLEAYFKNPDDAGYALIGMMDAEIKNNFRYPEEVVFEYRPTFLRAQVTEADSGWVFVHGKGTAKNAFGVASAFTYQCKLTIKPRTRRLDKVTVHER